MLKTVHAPDYDKGHMRSSWQVVSETPDLATGKLASFTYQTEPTHAFIKSQYIAGLSDADAFVQFKEGKRDEVVAMADAFATEFMRAWEAGEIWDDKMPE